jgi:glycosyltransferase involved in cell wall biosynthesis
VKLLIDGLSARIGGGVTRLSGLLNAMPKVAPSNRYAVILSRRYQEYLLASIPPAIDRIQYDIGGGSTLLRTFYQNMKFPQRVREGGYDAIHLSGEGAYLRIMGPSIMMSGNLSLFQTPHGQTGIDRIRAFTYMMLRRPFVHVAFRKASKVAFTSEVLRQQAIRAIHIPAEKTFILHHGVSTTFHPGPPVIDHSLFHERNGYCLCVSSINPHKGYETLLRAYGRLQGPVPVLAIAGGIADESTYRRMCNIIHDDKLADKVRILGPIGHDILPDIYRGARMFVFPSRLESFGLPLVEAMASGLPVIASDLPVCEEICGKAAIYVGTGAVQELTDAIQKVLDDSRTEEVMRTKSLVEGARFSWESTARILLREYEALLNGCNIFNPLGMI